MKLIPAPMRQFRTWSMILLIVAGIGDLGVVLAGTLGGLDVLSTRTLAIINAGFVFTIGAVRFVRQSIAMTTDQKVAVIADVSGQPVHAGQSDVAAVLVPLPPAQLQALPVLVDVDVGG